MSSICVVPCFWQNKYWDRGELYGGVLRTPHSKKGVEYFNPPNIPPESEPKEVKAQTVPKEEIKTPEPITFKHKNDVLAKWELNKLAKVELQLMIRRKYSEVVEDDMTKAKLIDFILEKQSAGITNQEIGNSVKGG